MIQKLRHLHLFILIGFIGLCAACKPENVQPKITRPLSDTFGLEHFWLVNEGNFQWGRGTLQLFNKQSFESLNASDYNADIEGNVFQSIAFTDKEAWLVFNNSGKIVVIDKRNLKTIKIIQGLNSPRYVTFSESEAFVSELYNNRISIISKATKEKVGELAVNQWSEKLWVINGTYLLAYTKKNDANIAERTSSLLLFNIKTKAKVDEISFEGRIAESSYEEGIGICAVNSLLDSREQKRTLYTFKIDEVDGKINFVDSLENNNAGEFKNTALMQMFTQSGSEHTSIALVVQGSNLIARSIATNGRLAMQNSIFPLDFVGNIYRISQVDNSNIMLSDARDFVSKGRLHKLSIDYNEQDSTYSFLRGSQYDAEVIPSHFYLP